VTTAILWQPTLFAAEAPAVDATFGAVVRHHLDDRTWVEHARGWLRGSEAVLEDLLGRSWEPRRADEPMRLRSLEATPSLDAMQAALSARYDARFDDAAAALFPNGRHVLGWTRHPVGEHFTNPVVATVVLGARRSIKVRPRTGGSGTTTFVVQPGDLFVTGGAAHDTWEHALARSVRVRDPLVLVTLTHARARDQLVRS